MSMSADEVAAVKATSDAVSANVGKHAQDFFIFFLKKFPAQQNKFPNYKGKAVDSLTSVPQFASHTKAVVADVILTIGIAHDSGALAAKGKQLVADHVPRGVGPADYADLFAALLPFLEQTLGGAYNANAKSGWEKASKLVLAALK